MLHDKDNPAENKAENCSDRAIFGFAHVCVWYKQLSYYAYYLDLSKLMLTYGQK